MCRFEKGFQPAKLRSSPQPRSGFSLVEATAALVILGFFCSGILVVINRAMAWAGDSAIRMQAFEVARENMEKLLSKSFAEESSESGRSEKYPEIKWETDVETFYEPVTSRMWVRAVCKAIYNDSAGQEQTIELEHWLTNVTAEQLRQLAEREGKEAEELGGSFFENIAEAAAYAGVDVQTIQKWIDDGMVMLDDGTIPKTNLDSFIEYQGNPPAEVLDKQIKTPAELADEGAAAEPEATETGTTEPEMTQPTKVPPPSRKRPRPAQPSRR